MNKTTLFISLAVILLLGFFAWLIFSREHANYSNCTPIDTTYCIYENLHSKDFSTHSH